MRALLLGVTTALAAAACGDEAIVIEIDTAAAPAATVELFVGTSACDDTTCGAGIQPPGAPQKLPGNVFFRDGAKRFVSMVGADGIARFRLEPGDLDQHVKFMLAVGGVDTGARTTGAALLSPLDPAMGPLRVLAALEPVRWFDERVPASLDGDGVQVWTDASGEASACVMFQRGLDRAFVVPDGDPDCDALVPDHCDELTYEASTRPSELSDARCAKIETTGGVCRLGGLECSDRLGPGVCSPLPWCVNRGACTCAGETREEMSACIDATFAPGNDNTRFICSYAVHATDANDPTHHSLCGKTELPLLAEAIGTDCDALLALSSLGDYDARQSITDAAGHTVKLELVKAEPGVCKFRIRAHGDTTVGGLTPTVHTLALKLETPMGRGSIVPIELRFRPVPSEECETAQVGCFLQPGNDGGLRCP